MLLSAIMNICSMDKHGKSAMHNRYAFKRIVYVCKHTVYAFSLYKALETIFL